MTVHEFWEGVAREAASLPEGQQVFALVSLDNREKGTTAGAFIYTDRKSAARRLFSKTHRLATPEETEAYERDQERVRNENAAIEVRRKQHFALPPELAALVEVAVRGGMPQRKER